MLPRGSLRWLASTIVTPACGGVTVSPTAGTFKVHLTADARRAVRVAWLVLG